MTGSLQTGSADGREGTGSQAGDTQKSSRVRRVRLGFGVLGFAVLTVITYTIARYRIFTGFTKKDDEGYMLYSLKSFHDHGWLYGGNGYGPLYYEFWSRAFSLFGIPVNHDNGRMMTLAVWLVCSLLIGLSTWHLTGSAFLGLAAQLSAFEALFSLATEPMHPGGIIVLLLATIVALSCFVHERIAVVPMALLGGAVMALILVKVNVGIFALAALALVCAVSYPAIIRHRWLRPIVEVGFVSLPLLLMSSRLGDALVRQFALHVTVAALAVVIALRARGVDRRDSKELWWLVGGVLTVGAAVSLPILTGGTSPSGLIDGVVLLPLRFPSVFAAPLVLPNGIFVFDLLPLAAALVYWYFSRNREARPRRTTIWFISALSILVGLFMAFGVIVSLGRYSPDGALGYPSAFRWGLLAFTWVALIEPPGKPDKRTQFARLLLPPLAVLQALHAYPIAGSQGFWATLLLIPVGALCVGNGFRWIAVRSGGQDARRIPFAIGAITAAVSLVALVGIHLKQEFDHVRAAYGNAVSLGLQGAERVRVSPEDAANYRALVAAINDNCDSFVALPRMNSFYLWTQQEPPSGYDPTDWAMIFDASRQQSAIDATRSIQDFCLLENAALTRFWGTDTKIPPGPLEHYLHRGFVPVAEFGDYQLLRRDGSSSRP